MNTLKSKLSRKFTKWYIKRGYTFDYDFAGIPIIGDGILRAPAEVPKSVFNCPWWVKPLLIFFSPSTYFIDTWGKMLYDSLMEGLHKGMEERVKLTYEDSDI